MTSDPIGDIENAQGRELIDSNGQPLGSIREIFLDEATSRPAWAAVDAPGAGGELVLAPLAHSTLEGDAVRVAVTREQVQTSPSTSGLTDRFSAEHMDRVRAHYAGQPAGGLIGSGAQGDATPTGAAGSDTVAAGDLPASMIRSEEALFVQRERIPRERVRLVKRIVTETVTQTIEVRREEVHFERIALTRSDQDATGSPGTGETVQAQTPAAGSTEDIAAGEGPGYADPGAPGTRPAGQRGAAGGGATGLSALRARASSLVERAGERFAGGHGFGEPFTDETLDLTLYEEQVVVSKRVVPRERVRIHREVVITPQQISDELRKERIEVERMGLDAQPGAEGSEQPGTPL